MRRIVIALMSTVSGLVLLFSYHTSLGGNGGGPTTVADPAGLPSTDPATDSPSDPAPSTDPAQTGDGASQRPSTSSPAAPATVSGTFTGQTIDTRWGPVQVRIVVKSNKITRATAIKFPNDNHHDQEINSVAVPQLQQATVATNGNNFDSVSGATVTSDGYKQSLQSALDQAHL